MAQLSNDKTKESQKCKIEVKNLLISIHKQYYQGKF
jgi:hypothetical protein